MTPPSPTNFESAMSLLTLALKTIEIHPPTNTDDLDRLQWAVQRADRAAVKAAGQIKEGRAW